MRIRIIVAALATARDEAGSRGSPPMDWSVRRSAPGCAPVVSRRCGVSYASPAQAQAVPTCPRGPGHYRRDIRG